MVSALDSGWRGVRAGQSSNPASSISYAGSFQNHRGEEHGNEVSTAQRRFQGFAKLKQESPGNEVAYLGLC